MELKRQLFEHYSTILDKYLEEEHAKLYFQSPVELIAENEEDFLKGLPGSVKIYSGATRSCFVDDLCDWVVKFDYSTNRVAHCALELDIYEAAKKFGLQEYFSEVIYLGVYQKWVLSWDVDEINSRYPLENHFDPYYYDKEDFYNNMVLWEEDGIERSAILISLPLYAYRKAEHCHSYDHPFKNISREYAKEVRSICSPLSIRSTEIAEIFAETYGIQEYAKLSDFLLKNRVDDIHWGNVGSIEGQIILIDYAGYRERDYYNMDEADYSHCSHYSYYSCNFDNNCA